MAMQPTDQNQVAQELEQFIRAFWLELPLTAANRIAGNDDDNALREAGWRAYDAFIRLGNEVANRAYTNPAARSIVGPMIESALRMQHAWRTLASAYFGSLWPALGLPTANELRALIGEVTALRKDFSAVLETGATANGTSPAAAISRAEALKLIRNKSRARRGRDGDEDAAA
jgi:hypothetical protein